MLETVEDRVAPLPVRQSAIALYNQILAFREHECVVFPWKQFLELVKNDDRSMSGDFEKELWHLEAIVSGVSILYFEFSVTITISLI